jgi:hypothetical protein
VAELSSAYVLRGSRRSTNKKTPKNYGGTMEHRSASGLEVPKANDRQVGGSHYKNKGGEEHWDRAWRLHYDPFQYIITKWVERWRDKGGLEDLKKAQHAIEKYIELVESEQRVQSAIGKGIDLDPAEATRGYCKQ